MKGGGCIVVQPPHARHGHSAMQQLCMHCCQAVLHENACVARCVCSYGAHACTLAAVTGAAPGGAVLGVCMGHRCQMGPHKNAAACAALCSAHQGGTGIPPCMLLPGLMVSTQQEATSTSTSSPTWIQPAAPSTLLTARLTTPPPLLPPCVAF